MKEADGFQEAARNEAKGIKRASAEKGDERRNKTEKEAGQTRSGEKCRRYIEDTAGWPTG